MNQRKRKAQAVTELTIFGAILIFVIGSILRNAADSGMNQNHSYKAMRWALLQSLYGIRNVNKSRDSASVTFLEDRLAPEAGKVGSMDRMPLLQQGSGSFTNTLYMPIDWLENQNLPVSDAFINGAHFSFSGAKFIVYDIRVIPARPAEIQVWDLTNNIITYHPKNGNWQDNCGTVMVDDGTGTGTLIPQAVGCPIFYAIVPFNSGSFCPNGCAGVITVDQQFDLNRNDDYTDDVAGATRPRMAWQWTAKRGLANELGIDAQNGVFPQLDIDADRKEETIFEVNPDSLWEKDGSGNYKVQSGKEPLVNKDVNMEALKSASYIIPINVTDPETGAVIGQEYSPREVVMQLYVMDMQKGDLDGSRDDWDLLTNTDPYTGLPDAQSELSRGLQRSSSVYSQANDGTFLEINEGKAYVPNFAAPKEFVRSINKKDKIDIISRVFQLDNNSGRFCGTASGERWATIGNESGGLPNPVQYCVNTQKFPGGTCFSNVTAGATCFDAKYNILYIRSRIEDTAGRKWVTQTK